MDLIAFYGTLRDPEVRERLGVAGLLEERGACRIPGRLHDLGRYPALVAGPGTVAGELFAVLDPAALPVLDAYEGAVVDDRDASLYVRERCALPAPAVTVWLYRYRADPPGPLLPGGDWLGRTAQRPTA